MTSPDPGTTPSTAAPRTPNPVSTTYLLLNLAVLIVLILVMLAWLRPLLIGNGVEASAASLYALSAGALVFTIWSRGTKNALLKDHREGGEHAAAGRVAQAITCYEKSLAFLSSNRWVDDLRWLILLDSSALSYREMALYNIGALHASAGDSAAARTAWERLLRDFPQTRLRETVAKDMTQLSGKQTSV
jgi:tetratricopeptide (TPR) repeat protein